MPVLWTEGLTKVFTVRNKTPGVLGSLRALVSPSYSRVTAVSGIGLRVDPGERVAFIGPNGAGKSTTIKLLTGILHPTSGTAEVLGLVPWVQRQQLAFSIGSVFGQKSQLWYHLPPMDTFTLLARIYELDEPAFLRRRDELIDLFELGDYLHTPVRKLSLGQRMRAEISASLLHRPRVLFLDEPTIGLDVVAKQRIRDLIQHMNEQEGMTVFLTSHDPGDIESVCKRVIVINQSRVIYDDRISALRRTYLRRKVVDLRLGVRVDQHWFEGLKGVQVLKASDYGIKLQVETDITPVASVVEAVLGGFAVHDISISDPPMEEIIASIFDDQRSGAPKSDADGALLP